MTNNNNLLSVSSLALCLTQQITYTSMSAVSWGSLMCLISHFVINNVVHRCHHSDLQLASRPLCQGSTCSHWVPTSADLSVPVPSAPPVPALLPLMHTLLVTACAAECEVISTSPTAVFSKYSLFSLFTRTQRGMYLLLSAHPSPVAADSQAAVGFNSNMPTPQAPLRVGFGSCSHVISLQECQEQQQFLFWPLRYWLTSKA